MNVASGRWRGADALVAALRRAGTTPVFTLSGNHIMSVFDAAIGSGLQLIHTRHEAAAVHMADAHARITGQVGVALVTGGPGHANAVSALYTAAMAEAPVLLLSGHAPHDQLGRGAFQEMRQAEMAAPVCKAAWVCSSADGVGADIARAMQIARSGRPGPVHLSLPTNVLESICTAPTPDALAFQPEVLALQTDVAIAMVQALLAAKRPLILAGPASMTRPGRAALATLEATCGVPVVGMESPRGVADASLGAFAQVLAQADVVLLLGKRLDFTLKFGHAPFPAQAAVLQIDADAAEIDRARQALGARLQLCATADAAQAVQTLSAVARPHADTAWLAEVRAAVAWRPLAWDHARSSLPHRLHPVQMLRPLQDLLDSHPDAVLVCDGGEIGQWAMACLSAPHRLNNGVAGAIGAGLPYALAARVALPTAPVVAVMGDGSVGFHIAEFDTAVRHGLGLVAVVGNDARWNAEHQIQLRDYGPQRLIACELNATRYEAVAAAFGAWGAHVSDASDMASTAQAALASGRPACVNVMIEGLAAPVIQR